MLSFVDNSYWVIELFIKLSSANKFHKIKQPKNSNIKILAISLDKYIRENYFTQKKFY